MVQQLLQFFFTILAVFPLPLTLLCMSSKQWQYCIFQRNSKQLVACRLSEGTQSLEDSDTKWKLHRIYIFPPLTQCFVFISARHIFYVHFRRCLITPCLSSIFPRLFFSSFISSRERNHSVLVILSTMHLHAYWRYSNESKHNLAWTCKYTHADKKCTLFNVKQPLFSSWVSGPNNNSKVSNSPY